MLNIVYQFLYKLIKITVNIFNIPNVTDESAAVGTLTTAAVATRRTDNLLSFDCFDHYMFGRSSPAI